MNEEDTRSYQDFLEERHASFQAPAALIASEVSKATNSAPIKKQRLILGENSEVYDITTADGQDVILRIARNNYPRFEEERWAFDHARVVGVPIPEVLLTDTLDENDGGISLCIERKLPGRPLDQVVQDLNKDELKTVITSAGELLSRIHSVPTTGYGELDRHGMGEYTTWDGYIFSLLNLKNHINDCAEKGGYDTNKIHHAIDLLKRNRNLFQAAPSRLLHADFGPKHILVDGTEISGIIDMENCKGGDPIREFAWWSFFREEEEPTDWLKEGYANKEVINDPLFDSKFQLLKLHLGLDMLQYYHGEGNKAGFSHSAREIDKSLKALS